MTFNTKVGEKYFHLMYNWKLLISFFLLDFSPRFFSTLFYINESLNMYTNENCGEQKYEIKGINSILRSCANRIWNNNIKKQNKRNKWIKVEKINNYKKNNNKEGGILCAVCATMGNKWKVFREIRDLRSSLHTFPFNVYPFRHIQVLSLHTIDNFWCVSCSWMQSTGVAHSMPKAVEWKQKEGDLRHIWSRPSRSLCYINPLECTPALTFIN